MSYFILHSGEDGTTIDEVSREELLRRITPDEDGGTYYGSDVEFLTEIPDSDKGCWYASENAVLVIEGKIIVPVKVEVATRYDLP